MIRRLAVGLGIALVATMTFAPSVNSAELWDGKWTTENQFGKPKLNLEEKKGEITGTYTDDGGATKGSIWGDVSDNGKVWTGRFKEKGDGDKGKFRVELLGTQVDFEGWFKSCEAWYNCSEKYTWTGHHN